MRLAPPGNSASRLAVAVPAATDAAAWPGVLDAHLDEHVGAQRQRDGGERAELGVEAVEGDGAGARRG